MLLPYLLFHSLLFGWLLPRGLAGFATPTQRDAFLPASVLKQLAPLLATLTEPGGTLTLFYLLPRVTGTERVAVLEKLLTFTTLPVGVTRGQVLALDTKALATWREELKLLWGGASQLGI